MSRVVAGGASGFFSVAPALPLDISTQRTHISRHKAEDRKIQALAAVDGTGALDST
jgi:hypothetical protein